MDAYYDYKITECLELQPEQVSIPLSQHIGAPAVPTVQKGDHVKEGQKIAEAGGFVSAPVYASVSGMVKGIEKKKFPQPVPR